MRILVYGAGVLGSYLAHNLYKGKKDVALLARGDWAKSVKTNGLVIKHKLKCGKTIDRIKVIETLEPDDKYDIIFVVMQYVHLDGVIPALQKNCSQTVVFVGNNMTAENYRSMLPEKNVLFGFTGVAGRRENGKVICISLGKSITLGTLDGSSEYRPFIESVFKGLKYKITYCDDMDSWLKSHAVFVLPIAYACYFAGGNLKKVAKNREMLNKIIDATVEGYNVLQTMGYTVLPKEDYDYVVNKRKSYYRLLKFTCATFVGRLVASDHAMSAIPEMRALSIAFDKIKDSVEVNTVTWEFLKQYLPEK